MTGYVYTPLHRWAYISGSCFHIRGFGHFQQKRMDSTFVFSLEGAQLLGAILVPES